MKDLKIPLNAPVVLTCVLVGGLLMSMDWLSQGHISRTYLSGQPGSLGEPLTWFVLVFHFLSFGSLQQYLSAMFLFVLIGPVLEEKYHSPTIFFVIMTASVLSGLLHLFFVPSLLQGADAVNTAFCVLLAMTLIKKGQLPASVLFFFLLIFIQDLNAWFILKETSLCLSHFAGIITGIAFGKGLTSPKQG